MSIKAIETRYAGCRFRSRLEARWAVFFDTLGIRWEYEPQGFETTDFNGRTWRYLPDFYLSDLGTWVEVKGSEDQLRQDESRLAWMLDYGSPIPGVQDSWYPTKGTLNDDGVRPTRRGLLILGPVPAPPFPDNVGHWLIQHDRGLRPALAFFGTGAFRVWSAYGSRSDAVNGELPRPYSNTRLTEAVKTPYDLDNPLFGAAFVDSADHAYTAARSARFEHGERG